MGFSARSRYFSLFEEAKIGTSAANGRRGREKRRERKALARKPHDFPFLSSPPRPPPPPPPVLAIILSSAQFSRVHKAKMLRSNLWKALRPTETLATQAYPLANESDNPLGRIQIIINYSFAWFGNFIFFYFEFAFRALSSPFHSSCVLRHFYSARHFVSIISLYLGFYIVFLQITFVIPNCN